MASSMSVASETAEKDWDTRGRYPSIMGEREPYGCGDGGRAPQTSADDGDLHPPFMRRVRQLTRARGVDGHEHHRLAGRGPRQTGPGPRLTGRHLDHPGANVAGAAPPRGGGQERDRGPAAALRAQA